MADKTVPVTRKMSFLSSTSFSKRTGSLPCSLTAFTWPVWKKKTGVSHLAKTRRFVTPETSAGCSFHLGDAVLLSPMMRDAACLSDGWLTRRLQHEPTVAPRQGGESLHTEAAAHGKINGLRHVESELGREQHRAARPSKLCGNGRQSAANGGNCRTPFR